MKQLFVYGSLCFKEILEKLTGKVFETSHATLHGYSRKKVKERDYPGIIKVTGEKVEGLLIKNLDSEALQVVTFYEGDEYQKEYVKVFTGTEMKKVLVFVWYKSHDLLENEDWSMAEFENKSLKKYLDEIIPSIIKEFRSIKG